MGFRYRTLLLCLAAVPGMIVAVLLTVSNLRTQTEQIEANVARLAKLGAAQHDNVIDSARMLLEGFARSRLLGRLVPAECAARFERAPCRTTPRSPR